MQQSEIAGLVKALAPIVGDFVSKAMEPLRAENKRLSDELTTVKSTLEGLPKALGPDETTILRLVEATVAKIPPALPGKDADPEVVAALINEAVAALPVPKDGEPGASVSIDEVAQLVDGVVAKALAAIELPKPDIAEIERLVGDRVEQAVAALPAPLAGKDADPAIVAQLVTDEVGKAVAALPAAKDGVGLAGALIDREGQLAVTMTDGASKALGVVVGKDVDMDAVAEIVQGEVAKIPVPKDGKDGADGVGFDDLAVLEEDGEVFLRFTRGDVVKEFLLPVTVDRGVWTEREFKKGAGVTWAGSFWIAQRATSAKPDTPDSGWRLAVKRGRDGASAFDVARKAGFRGSEREWLDSLRPGPAKPVKAGG